MEIYITIEQSNNYKTTLEKSIDKKTETFINVNSDNTLDSITTTCTGTITIDMDTILNNSIYFIWQCGLFNTENSGTTSTSNLQVQISFIK